MFSRAQEKVNEARTAAKRRLKEVGLSYRSAAPRLGVCYQHLCSVLNGRRESQRLLKKIEELSPVPFGGGTQGTDRTNNGGGNNG